MDFRKLAVAGAMLAAASPVGAIWWGSDDAYVKNADTYVKNVVETKADTGDNTIHGKYVGGWFAMPKISTGDADAYAQLSNAVNLTTLAGCGCFDDVTVKNWDTTVKNYVTTKADTGDNSISGYKVFGGKIKTGNAVAGSLVENVVNMTMIGDSE